MGRPKKIIESAIESVQVADLTENTAQAVVVKEEVKAVKGTSYSLTASFKTRTMEGDRIVHKYQGVGKTFAEALEGVVGNDEDLVDEYNRPFPKGINVLVNCAVRTSDGYEFTRALAPHVAKDILENKNEALAKKLLGLI